MNRTERQKLGIQKWKAAGCRGVIAWSTGVGKTRGAILAIKMFISKNENKKILVIVPTDNLKVQWMQELLKYGLFHDVKIEIINTAIEHAEKIDFLILDELHMMLGERYINIFKVKNPTLILGLSATFERLDNRQELIKHYCPVVDVIVIFGVNVNLYGVPLISTPSGSTEVSVDDCG
jgi:superfamily II DNA or RNA helicase